MTDHQFAFSGNLCDMLVSTAQRDGTRIAVVDGEVRISYDELARRSLAVAAALAGAGVASGDRVAMLLRRGADVAAAYFGALACGGVAVVVNEALRPRQIEHVVGHAGASVLVSTPAVLQRLPRELDTEARTLDIGQVPAEAAFEPVSRLAGDVAQIVYTSGSTGLPKGVTISHGNLWAGVRAVTSYLGLSKDDRITSLLPFSFDYGLNQLLCSIGVGATLVVERSPVAARIVRTLKREEVTVLAAVPPLWLQLLNVEAFTMEPLGSLRVMTNTGGRLPTEAVRALRRSHPDAGLFLMYGLTEAFRSTYLPPDRTDRKPDSIGGAIPGAEVLVLDADGRECAAGEVGELVHRGPTVAMGYWNDPEATTRVWRPHPLRPPGTPDAERVVFSGDLVRRDEEGDLLFVGREDGMIKTLGYRVSPDEVVEVLHASGEVVEAVVTSEPDEVRGARIVAYVVLREGGRAEHVEEVAARELPTYMQPARIEVRDELARTVSGKHDAAGTVRGP